MVFHYRQDSAFYLVSTSIQNCIPVCYIRKKENQNQKSHIIHRQPSQASRRRAQGYSPLLCGSVYSVGTQLPPMPEGTLTLHPALSAAVYGQSQGPTRRSLGVCPIMSSDAQWKPNIPRTIWLSSWTSHKGSTQAGRTVPERAAHFTIKCPVSGLERNLGI